MSEGTTPELTEVEMIEILKEIARDSQNAAARIAAVKELRAIAQGKKPIREGVADLYAVSQS